MSHRRTRPQAGFTLLELMAVVAILGILATLATAAYTRYVRSAYRSQVMANLANITLKQKGWMAVTGHYASTAAVEGPTATYPTMADLASHPDGMAWDVTDDGYTGTGGAGNYFIGGANMHGFDALRMVPEGGRSKCGYATISGWGTNALPVDNQSDPPEAPIADCMFPAGTEQLYASDWFYAYALCDLDSDGTYWALRTAQYASSILFTDVTDTCEPNGNPIYTENE